MTVLHQQFIWRLTQSHQYKRGHISHFARTLPPDCNYRWRGWQPDSAQMMEGHAEPEPEDPLQAHFGGSALCALSPHSSGTDRTSTPAQSAPLHRQYVRRHDLLVVLSSPSRSRRPWLSLASRIRCDNDQVHRSSLI